VVRRLLKLKVLNRRRCQATGIALTTQDRFHDGASEDLVRLPRLDRAKVLGTCLASSGECITRRAEILRVK
jgi:hypothetical protein